MNEYIKIGYIPLYIIGFDDDHTGFDDHDDHDHDYLLLNIYSWSRTSSREGTPPRIHPFTAAPST